MAVAIITGASRGLGLALARGLADDGWSLVIDGRQRPPLAAVSDELATVTKVLAIPGDVAHEQHRHDLVAAADELGGADVLINNAGILGPSPQPPLARYPIDVWRQVVEVNAVAPLRLIQLALPQLEANHGVIVNITSDAAAEPYVGWGGYGAAKAALDQLSAVLAVEHPALRVYAVDPGDMRTQMHQEAFPSEDISDRPLPEESVPGIVRLLARRPPSGRYQAREVV